MNLLPLVISNGLIDSFNPCAFGVMLFFVGLLVSLGHQKKLIITLGSFYILAIFITYFLLGMGIIQVTHLFGIPHFMARATAVLLVLIGAIQLINAFVPTFASFLSKCRIPRVQNFANKGTIPAALILGTLVGLCEFPCSGGIYLATVGLLSYKASFWTGTGLLVLYNFFFILPLLLLFMVATRQKVSGAIEKFHIRFGKTAKILTGLFSIILGLALFFWVM